jgi:hypothetical protein
VFYNCFCWSRSRTRRACVHRRNERLVFCGDEGVDLLAQLAWQVKPAPAKAWPNWTESGRDYAMALTSFDNRTRLLAVTVTVKIQPARATPRR